MTKNQINPMCTAPVDTPVLLWGKPSHYHPQWVIAQNVLTTHGRRWRAVTPPTHSTIRVYGPMGWLPVPAEVTL